LNYFVSKSAEWRYSRYVLERAERLKRGEEKMKMAIGKLYLVDIGSYLSVYCRLDKIDGKSYTFTVLKTVMECGKGTVISAKKSSIIREVESIEAHERYAEKERAKIAAKYGR
jgi:hypothetical protein